MEHTKHTPPPPPSKYEIRQYHINGRYVVKVKIPGLMQFETNRQHDEMNQSGAWTPTEDHRMLKIIKFGISKEVLSVMTGRPQSAIHLRLRQLSILYSLDEWDYIDERYNVIRSELQLRLKTNIAGLIRFMNKIHINHFNMKIKPYEIFNKEEWYDTKEDNNNDDDSKEGSDTH